MLKPCLVVQISPYGLTDAGIESFYRPPPEFTLDFACIYGIAAVMARAIGDEGDLFVVGFAVRLGG